MKSTRLAFESDLLKVLDLVREAVDQIGWNAAADALQSFPTRNRQIDAADELLAKIDAFRSELADAPKLLGSVR